MTIIEGIHTLRPEDKDDIVGSYLSFLAYFHVHMENIPNTDNIKYHAQKLIQNIPENAQTIYEEFINNERERIVREDSVVEHPEQ